MVDHTKIYVIILFPQLNKATTLDRNYNSIEADWKKVLVSDLVQVSDKVIYPQCSGWAHTLVHEGYEYTAMWTNYYNK